MIIAQQRDNKIIRLHNPIIFIDKGDEGIYEGNLIFFLFIFFMGDEVAVKSEWDLFVENG